MGDDQSSCSRTALRPCEISDLIWSSIGGDNRFFERWSLIRQLGLWEYIWVEGILGSGFMLVLVSIFMDAFYGRPVNITSLLILLLICTVFGVISGLLGWRYNERRFHRIHARMQVFGMSQNNVDERSTYTRHRARNETSPQ
jgi:hypothetical protein